MSSTTVNDVGTDVDVNENPNGDPNPAESGDTASGTDSGTSGGAKTGNDGSSDSTRPGDSDARSRLLSVGGTVARPIITLVASVAAIVVLWTVFIELANVSEFVAKTPADVWAYLVGDAAAGDNRVEIAGELGTTLGNAVLGYVLGLGLAAAVTLLFYFFRLLEDTFLPTVTALNAIPTVTIAPILVLIFGRETFGVAVIGAVVVFVPALLLMIQGIHSAPASHLTMCRAYGGSTWSLFWKVSVPHAVPSWFSAARIAVTTSVVGALLAEWLASGEGLGGQMLSDANSFQFDRLWAGVVVLTVTCVVIYNVVSLLEKWVTHLMTRSR